MVRRLFLTLIALCIGASTAHAQLRPRRAAKLPRVERGQEQLPLGQQNRQQLQRRVQQALWKMTQRRVGLSDGQMNQLAPVHQRYEQQRRMITREERQTRLALRDAMRDSSHMNQAQISGYMDRLVQIQRQRADLLEQEQKDLSEFMTPLQRARYTALQEQVRRRVEQLARQNRAGVAPDSGPSAPPRP
jgi:hypothetical protein